MSVTDKSTLSFNSHGKKFNQMISKIVMMSSQFKNQFCSSCHLRPKMNTILSDIFQSFKYLFTLTSKWKNIYISIGVFCFIVIFIATVLAALIVNFSINIKQNVMKLFSVLYQDLQLLFLGFNHLLHWWQDIKYIVSMFMYFI